MNRTLNGWLQLVRAPNLLTAPGDAMAGAALAALFSDQKLRVPILLAVGAAALCLYAFGLILNDLSDLEEDRVARPERPLVRKTVPVRHARWAALCIGGAGLLAAAIAGPAPFVTALLLLTLIVSYNRMTKHNTSAGPVNMGMCRGASLLMGTGLGGWPFFPVIAAVGLSGYIAEVTRLAEVEDRPVTFGAITRRAPFWFAAAFLVVWFPAVLQPLNSLAWLASLLIAAAGGAVVFLTCRNLGRGVQSPAQIRAAIGQLLRVLIVLQAAFLMLGGQPSTIALAILWLAVLLPANHLISRRFAAS